MTSAVIKQRLGIIWGKAADVSEIYLITGAKTPVDQKRVRGVLCYLKRKKLIEHIGRARYYFPQDPHE